MPGGANPALALLLLLLLPAVIAAAIAAVSSLMPLLTPLLLSVVLLPHPRLFVLQADRGQHSPVLPPQRGAHKAHAARNADR